MSPRPPLPRPHTHRLFVFFLFVAAKKNQRFLFLYSRTHSKKRQYNYCSGERELYCENIEKGKIKLEFEMERKMGPEETSQNCTGEEEEGRQGQIRKYWKWVGRSFGGGEEEGGKIRRGMGE